MDAEVVDVGEEVGVRVGGGVIVLVTVALLT